MSRSTLLLALLIPMALTRADPKRSMVDPNHQEGAIEIRSYGEHARDFQALLVQFFYKSGFSPFGRGSGELAKDGSSVFSGPHGDFVSTTGRFNCIIVAYSSIHGSDSINGTTANERFNLFRAALKEFLASLPAPRPVPRDLQWRDNTCLDAA
jgi:hypothetical protein